MLKWVIIFLCWYFCICISLWSLKAVCEIIIDAIKIIDYYNRFVIKKVIYFCKAHYLKIIFVIFLISIFVYKFRIIFSGV